MILLPPFPGHQDSHLRWTYFRGQVRNPDLDSWRFGDARRFTLVLTATVLSELDRLKVEHRNPDFRAKVEGLINRLKSYRSRGQLSRGVVLRRDVSTIKTIALEPKVEETLPWLDADNASCSSGGGRSYAHGCPKSIQDESLRKFEDTLPRDNV